MQDDLAGLSGGKGVEGSGQSRYKLLSLRGPAWNKAHMAVDGLRFLGMILCCSVSLLKPAWLLFASRCQVSVVLPPFFLRAWSQLPSGQSPTLSGQQTPTLGSRDHISEPTHWSSSSPDSPILPTGVI